MDSMGKYHICNTNSNSGIVSYGDDFFRIVLQNKGFCQISPENITREWLKTLSKNTAFHVELGSSQFSGRNALICLIDCGFENIDVTIHDAPWVTFPFYHSRYALLNQLLKAFDWYFNTAGATKRLLKRCRHVYVLSQLGKTLLEQRHKLTNVLYLPHVIDPDKIWRDPINTDCRDILFFGFIGAIKGLEYALAVHSELRKFIPDIRMYVIGEAFNNKAQSELDRLIDTYSDGVTYLGFVRDSELDGYFSRVSHVFLPFLPYKYWCPCSGSILNALRRGRIVWTNPVNAIPEIVRDGVNGQYFTGDVGMDAAKFLAVTGQREKLLQVSTSAIDSCHQSLKELRLKYKTD
ncbi:MAG: glycosyltransferase [Pelobacteraceae bacterium]